MSDVEEIKSRLNIADIIGKRVTLKKAGRNFKALCPFHNEKTPSFIVSPDRQTYHCFGCGKGGDIFSFVMEYDHVDFPEALEELASQAGVTLTRRIADTPQTKLKEKILEVNHLAGEFYQYLLTRHKLGQHALDYLKNRGISDKAIKTFSLGYSPNSWDGLLKYLKKKGYEEELLEQAGLVISRQTKQQGGYYDRFRGRVMFTLKDHRGNVVGFAGRVLHPNEKDLPAGRQEAKYINTPETPVYIKGNLLYGLDVTKDAIQKANEAVVMEGELDVISSFQAGVANAVAIKGSALTEGHVHLLRRFTERLVFALDSDLAGDAAARRGIELADAAGLDMRVVALPSGKDPDEAARENPTLLKKAISDAMPVYDYFIASSLRRFDVATAFGKKKAGDELLTILANIENPIVQEHYVKKLAKALDTTEEAITEGMRKLAKPQVRQPEDRQQSPVKTRQEKLELYFLALLLQGETIPLFDRLNKQQTEGDIAQPAVMKLFIHLASYLKNHKQFSIRHFADSVPKELLPTLDEAFLWDISDLLEDKDAFGREWKRLVRELRRVNIRHSIEAVARELKHADLSSARVKALHEQLRALTAELKPLET